ncbi:MAG TPA: ABC transporter ATP-binding protein [Candidatus Deferrimicrobium sp.]|nr:ABC transporter ATP-binding protein [Candidatus Deferrimicrobium sp.]
MADAIVLQDVSKKYGSFEALRGVTLSIAKGTVFGLLGPNGAGKTTTLRICSTLLKPTHGRIFFDGKEINTDLAGIRRSLAEMPQGHALDLLLNVEDNLRFYCKLRKVPARMSEFEIEKAVEIFGLGDFRKKGVLALSGGQFRRAQLARTFLGKPKYILLDEPSLGIDIQGKLAMWQAIKEYVSDNTCTILLASNDVTEVERTCGRVGFIRDGELLYVGKKDNLSGEIKVKLTVNLSRHCRFSENLSADNIKVVQGSDTVITLEFAEYTRDVLCFLEALRKKFGITSMSETKTSLTDLFDRYGTRPK